MIPADKIARLRGLAQKLRRLIALEAERDALAERVDKLHNACEAANAAIDDWRCMYAWTECDRADVTAAAGRILDNGGALAYAASVQKLIRAALATPSAAKGSK